MRTRILFLSLALIAVSITTMSFTAAAPWRQLGSKSVDYLIDHDAIDIGYRGGTFQKLKISVTSGSLNMHRCVIHFENGQEQTVDFRQNFKKGSASRIIDLAGNRRHIDRISFWYDSKHNSPHKAVVTVWGR